MPRSCHKNMICVEKEWIAHCQVENKKPAMLDKSELDINNPSTCEIPPKVSTGGDARMPGLLGSLDLTGQ